VSVSVCVCVCVSPSPIAQYVRLAVGLHRLHDTMASIKSREGDEESGSEREVLRSGAAPDAAVNKPCDQEAQQVSEVPSHGPQLQGHVVLSYVVSPGRARAPAPPASPPLPSRPKTGPREPVK